MISGNVDRFEALLFAKEVLRTPISDLPKIPLICRAAVTKNETADFYYFKGDHPMALYKKGLEGVGIQARRPSALHYYVWIYHSGSVFELEGTESRIIRMKIYSDLVHPDDPPSSFYEKIGSIEFEDHQDWRGLTILELRNRCKMISLEEE